MNSVARIRARLNSDLPCWLAVVLVMTVAIYFTFPQIHRTLSNWNSNTIPSWEGHFPGKAEPHAMPDLDIDTWLIHGGVVAAPSFKDTLCWWHGTWAGQVVFYRPISSYAFWIDWKLFGSHEARYGILSVLLHLLAVGQFTILSFSLFRYFRLPKPGFATLISGLFFVDGLFALGVRQETNAAVFENWKNMPESLVTLFFCLSLTAYVNLIAEREANVSRAPGGFGKVRQFAHSAKPVIWYLASCGSKEAGILMPLLLLPLELPQLRAAGEKRSRALRRMIPVLAALPLFLIMRRLFLGMAIGYRYGSNGSWVGRLTDNLFGTAGHNIRTGRYVPVLMGLSLAFAVYFLADAGLRKSGGEGDRRMWRAAGASVAVPSAPNLLCVCQYGY